MADQINIRTVLPAQDFPQIALLLSLVEPEPVTAESLHEWENLHFERQIRQREAAIASDGTIAGYAYIERESWMPAGRFSIFVVVDPAHRGRGIGTALYNKMLAFARQHDLNFLDSETREDCAEGLRFAQERGFSIDHHMFESTIDLKTFDESRFSGIIEAVETSGIRLSSLAAEGDTEENRRKLWRVNYDVYLDDPASNGNFPDFDEFNTILSGAWFKAEGQLVAVDGDRYVGLSAVGYYKDTNSMYNMMTGVDRDYRGRGLAQALKLLSIRFAKNYGADYIRTNNDSHNAPMLAINRKFGYVPHPGVYRLVNPNPILPG